MKRTLRLSALTALPLYLSLVVVGCTSTVSNSSTGGAGGTGDTGGMGGAGGSGGAAVACGDGAIGGSEACDDGNVTAGDGCAASCTIETGYTCTGTPSVCADIDECAMNNGGCAVNATCVNTPGSFLCTCQPQLEDINGNGTLCEAYSSCRTLKAGSPALPDGVYPIDPDGNGPLPLLEVACDMTTAGGGWTMAFNSGFAAFDMAADGVVTTVGPNVNATSLAYSTVPIFADIMLDANDGDISGTAAVRTIVTGIHSGSVGMTVRALFTSAAPHYLELEDNSNVVNVFAGGETCATLSIWSDYAPLICSTQVITTADVSGCTADKYAIGSSMSYTVSHGNCAGWPQNPGADVNHWPDNYRVWVR